MQGDGDAENCDVLSIRQLKAVSKEFDVESIHTLNLSHSGLNNILVIGQATCVERLDLSYNDLTSLQPLGLLTKLSVLNVSANRLSSLRGLESCEDLQRLTACGNLIGSTDALRGLGVLEKFKHLTLKDDRLELTNPVCMGQGYREDVLRFLPDITSLDGEIVKGAGKELFEMARALAKQLEDSASKRSHMEMEKANDSQQVTADDKPQVDTHTDHVLETTMQQFNDELSHAQDLREMWDIRLKELEGRLLPRK